MTKLAIRLVVAVVLICLFWGSPASAQVKYNFIGIPFTSFSGTSCPSTCRITGSFVVAQPLPPNLNCDIGRSDCFTPASFSFSDGTTTFTNLNSSNSGFAADTDANGNITFFSFFMVGPGGGAGMFAFYDGPNQLTQEEVNLDRYQVGVQGLGIPGGCWYSSGHQQGSGCVLLPTDTTLSVTPNPVTAGQVVTLTASVTSADGPVNEGTVSFEDSSRGTVLGTVQLLRSGNSSGTATLKWRFASATCVLSAVYNGTAFLAPSSFTAPQLTVTGTEPTISTLSAQPAGNNYDFALAVFGFGFPALSGSATLNKLTQGGSLLGEHRTRRSGCNRLSAASVFPHW
jgi:hypothetical protein